jgi:4-hydroxybenzoate polyprenyltransferase
MNPTAPLHAAPAATLLPLCVDLDGTLVRSDTLLEDIFSLPLNVRLLWCFAGLFSGRAVFKKRVAQTSALQASLLPYNAKLLAYLREQKAAGRSLILATAADSITARKVAEHLELFDEVIASDGEENIKGHAKARVLSKRFGEKGFAYAGNSSSDLPVWCAAGSAVIVNAPRRVAASARDSAIVEAEIAERPALLPAILRAMRPHQWVKNVLVFVPIVTAHAMRDLATWSHAAFAFLAFSATASGIYLLNDISDLSADRTHPRKSARPFASGEIPLHLGVLIAVVLLGAGTALAILGNVLDIVLIYALMSVAYTARLKTMPLVDVFMLAGLYTIRLFGGGRASGWPVSFWLLAFSNFLFLGLALVKRVAELKAIGPQGFNLARRGYRLEDIPILQMFGCGSALAASLVLALFIESEATVGVRRYATPGVLWGLVPLILFWQFRLWLATTRGNMHDDPIVYAAGDWVTWLVCAASLAVLLAAKSLTFH